MLKIKIRLLSQFKYFEINRKCVPLKVLEFFFLMIDAKQYIVFESKKTKIRLVLGLYVIRSFMIFLLS